MDACAEASVRCRALYRDEACHRTLAAFFCPASEDAGDRQGALVSEVRHLAWDPSPQVPFLCGGGVTPMPRVRAVRCTVASPATGRWPPSTAPACDDAAPHGRGAQSAGWRRCSDALAAAAQHVEGRLQLDLLMPPPCQVGCTRVEDGRHLGRRPRQIASCCSLAGPCSDAPWGAARPRMAHPRAP